MTIQILEGGNHDKQTKLESNTSVDSDCLCTQHRLFSGAMMFAADGAEHANNRPKDERANITGFRQAALCCDTCAYLGIRLEASVCYRTDDFTGASFGEDLLTFGRMFCFCQEMCTALHQLS